MADSTDSALVVAARELPAPAFSGAEMGQALRAYKEMQTALDSAMPDQLMQIQGRTFRRKGYWRTVARAFRLKVECIKEDRISGTDDWGFVVTYRATTPSGDQADGDGACSASEKYEGQDTLHNVRAHAHTRAYNRAVSNLVGFGEVSAEEMEREPTRTRQAPMTPEERAVEVRFENGTISERQAKRLWALAAERAKALDGVSRNEIMREVIARRGLEHTHDIPRAAYESVCEEVSAWDPPVGEPDMNADAGAF